MPDYEINHLLLGPGPEPRPGANWREANAPSDDEQRPSDRVVLRPGEIVSESTLLEYGFTAKRIEQLQQPQRPSTEIAGTKMGSAGPAITRIRQAADTEELLRQRMLPAQPTSEKPKAETPPAK